jgi:hypothetical protein
MPALARRAANVATGVDDEPPWNSWRADPTSVGPAEVAMARLAAASPGSAVVGRWDSPYDVLWGRLFMVERTGAELIRWLARRKRVGLDAPAAARCFLEKEKKSVKDERLVRNASSGSSVEGRLPACVLSLVANAAILNGVPAVAIVGRGIIQFGRRCRHRSRKHKCRQVLFIWYDSLVTAS